MSRFESIFNKKAFISFITAGDPSMDMTLEYIDAMIEAGVALIEIGIPFSDPTAEGKTIEKANLRALSNHATTDKMFDMLKKARAKHPNYPFVFMTYLNPVFGYGYDRFFKKCEELDIHGIIVPDLPFEEKQEVKEVALKYDVSVISLIAPTSKDRIKMIASNADGFIYLVSSLGVTGVRSEITTDINELVTEIKKYAKVPVAVGFGIKTPDQAKKMTELADGVIVGSAIVNLIEEHKENAKSYIYNYCKEMVDSIL